MDGRSNLELWTHMLEDKITFGAIIVGGNILTRWKSWSWWSLGFSYWMKNIFIVITIIGKVACWIIKFCIRVFLGKAWASFIKDFLEFLRGFCCSEHGLELLFLEKKLWHVITSWSLCGMLKEILLNCIKGCIIFQCVPPFCLKSLSKSWKGSWFISNDDVVPLDNPCKTKIVEKE